MEHHFISTQFHIENITDYFVNITNNDQIFTTLISNFNIILT